MSKLDNTIIGSNLPQVNGNIKFHLMEKTLLDTPFQEELI